MSRQSPSLLRIFLKIFEILLDTGTEQKPKTSTPIKRQAEVPMALSPDFTFAEERQAAQDHQRVWISYEDSQGGDTERNIEIYNPQDAEYIFAWCCLRKGPRTFRRDRIKQWKILEEQFDFNPLLERWFEEEYPQGDNAIPWPRFREMHGGRS